MVVSESGNSEVIHIVHIMPLSILREIVHEIENVLDYMYTTIIGLKPYFKYASMLSIFFEMKN